MSNPFVGQLLAVGFNFAPNGWAFAAGQLFSISQNTALFSLLGTNYGGDGKSTFGLPNLQGNIANSSGQGPGLSNYFIGQTGGEDSVPLLNSEYPAHTHKVAVLEPRTGGGNAQTPANNFLAKAGGSTPPNYYAPASTPGVFLAPTSLSVAGGSQPHNNLMPYLCINWIIALQGVFPARS